MQIPANDAKATRFYHLFLEPDLLGGWSVIREWGFQGASGRIKRDHFPLRNDAEQALLKLRDIQLQHGYRVVFIQGERVPR